MRDYGVRVALWALLMACSTTWAASAPLQVKVVNPQGEPVAGASVALQSGPSMYGARTRDEGVASMAGQPSGAEVELVVAAPGFAPTVWRGAAKDLSLDRPIRLQPGRTVTLRLTRSDGQVLPRDLRPQVVGRDDLRLGLLLSQAFIAEATGSGAYEARVAADAEEVFVLVNHPGVVYGYVEGPFKATEPIEVKLPPTASLTVAWSPTRPVAEGSTLLRITPLTPKVSERVENRPRFGIEDGKREGEMALVGLLPGRYRVDLYYWREPGTREAQERLDVKLEPNGQERLKFEYAVFDPASARGEHELTVELKQFSGEPATGCEAKLHYRNPADKTRGVVAKATTDEHGTLRFPNLAGAKYHLEVIASGGGSRRASYFPVNLENAPREHTVELRLGPVVGDIAPDIEMIDAFTGDTAKLSDYRGQVVLLDFWATWCGPCQAPMAHSNDVIKRKGEAWKNRAAIIGLSIDDKVEVLRKHLDERGWRDVKQMWAGRGGWKTPPMKRYSVSGVPTAFLIDADGRIVWTGHPGNFDAEGKIEKLLKN